jgi:hypothetical protein
MENHTPAPLNSQLSLVGPGGELPLDRRTVEALAEFFVGMLDLVEPDTDIEETDAEDELLSPRAIAFAEGHPGCIASDSDYCTAGDDNPALLHGDGLPGDESDREEDDPSGDPLDDGELGDCHGAYC